MIIAVDTNVLLDILIPDEKFFLNSKQLLDLYIEKGQLIICEIVYGELASQFSSEIDLKTFLLDSGMRLVNSNEKTLHLAGELWKKHISIKTDVLECSKCGEEITLVCPKCSSNVNFRKRILSDFIIGAHAIAQSDLLLSRDRGFFRKYFKNLRVVS